MTLPINASIAGLDLGEHHVRRLTLREGIHRTWSLIVEVGSTHADLDLERAIGEAVVITLPDEPFVPTLVGILLDVRESRIETTGESTYLLHVGPASSQLGLRRTQHIHMWTTVIDVTLEAFERLAVRMPQLFTSEPHPQREYRVQWKESDLDFVLRLLADEGLSLIHDPRTDRTRIVDDTRTTTEVIAVPLEVRPDADALREPNEPPCARRVALARTLTSGAVMNRDYDFERPDFVPEDVLVAEQPSAEAALEEYEFQVGEYADEAGAALTVRRRLEAARREARVLEVETNAIVSAGCRITLTHGPRPGIDGEHLVVSTETTWTSEARMTLLRCIPATTRYRPARRPKPRIHGTHTAFVVTRGEKEVDVDEHGRVQVEFRWHRTFYGEGTSRRVRVSQPWAGPGYGMTLLPRRGEEVVISYVDGDPEEPIIVGRVHNGRNRDPLTLPAQQTQSIWKSRSVPGTPDQYNMIRMEDAAGAEMLELRAQRDFRSETLRNAETIVGVDESKKVGGSSKTEVAGAYSLQSASTSIGTGAYSLSATSITMNATGDIKETSGGNHTIDTGSFWVSASGVAQISATKIVLMAGGSNITITPGGISITSAGPVDVHGAPIKLNC